jgi:hypothetical protein
MTKRISESMNGNCEEKEEGHVTIEQKEEGGHVTTRLRQSDRSRNKNPPNCQTPQPLLQYPILQV